MTSYACTRGDCPEVGESLPFELFVVHALDHVNEGLAHMTDSISQLQAADADEQNALDANTTALKGLVDEQVVFLGEIKADLAGLGNNDQVSAIAVKVEARAAQLQAATAQVTQLQSDQTGFDAGIPASPADAGTAPATPIESTDDGATTLPVDAPVGLGDGTEAASPTD
jgi:hypothetical protein